MPKFVAWIWRRGIVSTFLAGLFALLPIVITVAIVGWVVGFIESALGPSTAVGRVLRSIGLRFAANDTAALAIGWGLVLVGVWLLGLLVKSKTQHRMDEWFRVLVDRIPLVKSIYGTAAQVVGMLKRDDANQLQGLSVVYCAFGDPAGAGFLALLATPETFIFGGREFRMVYIPTAPIPMSGAVICVPSTSVTPMDMTVDSLMQVYFSMGIMAPQAVPAGNRVLVPAQP
jgi:uncharacterized membrane protein